MTDGNPMDLLKEEMENDEIAVRVNAIHRIKIICTLIGQDGIKNQLLPYIDQLIKKEEDEVLFAIAQEIETLAAALPQQQIQLLGFLENLAGQEETVVRDKAVQALIQISAGLSDNDISQHYIPLIMRLAANEANFTHRVSAVYMMVQVYPRAGTHKEKIRQKFSELSGEETPMVRRVIAQKIGEMSQVVEKEHVLNDLIQSVKQLISDEQDQVRVLGLNSLKFIAKVLNKDENKAHTLPIIIAATEDKSWKVRLSLSKIFSELAEAFGKEVADGSLIQIFTNLLRDVENDVRQASILSLIKLIKIISNEKLVIIVPHLQYLAKDSVPQVRSGAAEVIGIMSSLVQREVAVQKLLPHITDMFNDENKEVRESVTRAATKFIEAIGSDVINNFLPHFKKAIEDEKWRVRLVAYDALTELAKYFHNQELFQKTIEPLYMNYLKDKTAAVREFGGQKISSLVQVFKNEWVFQKLLPKLIEGLNKDISYLYRIAALHSLKIVALNISPELAVEKIFPLFYKNLSDSVPNIRIVVIKICKELIQQKYDSPNVKNEMKQNINPLANDNDRDVKQIANEFIQYI